MNKHAIIGLVLISLFVVSCAQQKEDLPVPSPIENTPPPETAAPVVEEIPQPAAPVQKSYSKDVEELLLKGKGKANYKYYFSSMAPNQFGQYEEKAGYDLYVRDSKMKKSYASPVKIDSANMYDAVYLDSAEKKAFGMCITDTNCVNIQNKAYPLDYESEKVSLTPSSILKDVSYDAKIVGTEIFDSSNTKILEYVNKDGDKERLNIDSYSGLPLKQIKYIIENDVTKDLSRNMFTQVVVGSVKLSDVQLPSGVNVTG